MEQHELLKLLDRATKKVKWGIKSPNRKKIYWIQSNNRKKKNPWGRKKKKVISIEDRIKLYRMFYEIQDIMGTENSPF